jgi:hypothetical protein
VAGGAITGRRSPAPGVYEVSQLSLGSEQPLWVSADSYDVDAQAPADEIFHIAVGHDAERGREEYERRWRPRRAELRSAPSDLDLGPFRAAGRAYALLIEHVAVAERNGPANLSVARGLLVTAASGERLLFWADHEVPLDMFVTAHAAVIEQHIAQAAALTPVAPEA